MFYFISLISDLTNFLSHDMDSATSTAVSPFVHLQYEDLDKECDDNLLIKISQHLQLNDQLKVGHCLNLSSKTLESISLDKQDNKERMIDMLWEWKAINGITATSVELVKAFLKMEDEVIVKIILTYHSKKVAPEPLKRTFHIAPEKAKDHYPNWDDLLESEKEAMRNKLMDENRAVRKAYATFVVQLIKSFIKRQVNPKLVKPLIRSYGISDVNQHQPDFGKDDNIADVFDELSSHCMWFNYELFKIVVEILGNEDEKKYLKTYEEDNLIPYLKRSIFEIPCGSQSQSQCTNLLFKVPLDLYITGNEVKAVQRNLAKLLGLENGAILHFEDYNIGSIELVFSLPIAVLNESPPDSQLFAFIEWKKSKNCYEVNADLFTVL